MALPITVPYTFGNATTAIPLSNLDSDYATVYQAVHGIGTGSVELANVTITGGTVSNVSGVVPTPFTANGVVYASSTSALATGSALVFDGTNLGIGAISSAWDTTQNRSITFGPYASYYGSLSYNNGPNATSIATHAYNTTTAATTGWKYSGAGVYAGLYQFNGTSGTHAWYNAPSGTAGNAITFTQAMTLDAGSNLLVGKTSQSITTNGYEYSPAYWSSTAGQLGITGNSSSNSQNALAVYSTAGSAYRFYVTYAGSIYATNIVITAISDQRLKENVRDIETGLDAIMALKPRRFDWKEGKGQDKKNVAGFIAQEFETVFPECVSTSMAGADGIEYKNINHETLIPTLVKAIQEQQTLIKSLTARLTALENK